MNNTQCQIGLILLAAGASTRYGDFPKQLLKINHKTLIKHAAETALNSSAHRVCVVLGANFEIIRNEIKDLPVEISVNGNWADGMSSSIKNGLQHLLKIEPNLSAVVLQLCDQPLITRAILNQIIQKYIQTSKQIVASKYGKTFGVPALFDKNLFVELLNLDDHCGAKKIIKKYRQKTAFIEIPEAETDIDTRRDYQKLKLKENILQL
jgi:molybdenum cofactor cytidylyltransferase